MSIAKSQKLSKNPAGFPERLRLLMEGWGYSTRDLGAIAGVSHGTIANWLNDSSRAGLDEADKVARVFGWSAAELFDGEPKRDVMSRVAELEGFRAKVRRVTASLAMLAGATDADFNATAGETIAPLVNPLSEAKGKRGTA